MPNIVYSGNVDGKFCIFIPAADCGAGKDLDRLYKKANPSVDSRDDLSNNLYSFDDEPEFSKVLVSNRDLPCVGYIKVFDNETAKNERLYQLFGEPEGYTEESFEKLELRFDGALISEVTKTSAAEFLKKGVDVSAAPTASTAPLATAVAASSVPTRTTAPPGGRNPSFTAFAVPTAELTTAAVPVASTRAPLAPTTSDINVEILYEADPADPKKVKRAEIKISGADEVKREEVAEKIIDELKMINAVASGMLAVPNARLTRKKADYYRMDINDPSFVVEIEKYTELVDRINNFLSEKGYAGVVSKAQIPTRPPAPPSPTAAALAAAAAAVATARTGLPSRAPSAPGTAPFVHPRTSSHEPRTSGQTILIPLAPEASEAPETPAPSAAERRDGMAPSSAPSPAAPPAAALADKIAGCLTTAGFKRVGNKYMHEDSATREKTTVAEMKKDSSGNVFAIEVPKTAHEEKVFQSLQTQFSSFIVDNVADLDAAKKLVRVYGVDNLKFNTTRPEGKCDKKILDDLDAWAQAEPSVNKAINRMSAGSKARWSLI